MILSQHTNHLHKWLVQLNFVMFTAAMFFFYKIPKYVLDQNNIRCVDPPGLWLYGWWTQAGLALCDLKLSRKSL